MLRRPLALIVLLVLLLLGMTVTVTIALGKQNMENRPHDGKSSSGYMPGYALVADIQMDLIPAFAPTTFDPVRNRLYIAHSFAPAKITVIDTKKDKFVSTTGLEQSSVETINASADGKRLFLSGFDPAQNGNRSVVVLEADSFREVGGFPVPCANSTQACSIGEMAVGPDDRLYTNSDDQRIQVVNSITGAVIGKIQLPDGYTMEQFAIMENKLFMVIGTQNWRDVRLRRYDISAAEPVLELDEPIMYRGPMHSVSRNGAFLLLGLDGQEAFQYDAQTLQFVRQYRDKNNSFFEGRTFTYEGDAIAATYSDMVSHLVEFDAETGILQRTGDISMLPQFMVGLPDNEVALISVGGVQIYRAMDYTTLLPVVFHEHCGNGPVFDPFDDPASGWPIGELDTASFGYDQSEYRISFSRPGSWLAVTRGDYWHEAYTAAVDGRLLNGTGSYGLVFGLNDDWTEFYTFENDSELGFIILHYTEAAGWELIFPSTPQISSGPTGPSDHSPSMVIEADGSNMVFRMNHFSYAMPAVDGRIGLIASSLPSSGANDAAMVEARFDNYEFVGKNCPLLPPRLSLGQSEQAAGTRGSVVLDD